MQNSANDFILLMTGLMQLKNEKRVVETFTTALNNLHPEFHVKFCKHKKKDQDLLFQEICTQTKSYGYLQISGSPQNVSKEFPVLFQNSVQMLALVLEKLSSQNELIHERNDLEQEVIETTVNAVESEQRFRTVVENLPSAVIAHDLNGRIIMVNKNACLYTGYKNEELLNLKIMDIDPESESRRDMEKIWHQLKDGQSTNIERIVYRKDRSHFQAEIHITGMTLHGKKIILGIMQDITERKQAEELLIKSEENLYTTLNSINDAVIATDLNGCVVRMNPIAQKLTGYSMDEALGKSLSIIFHIVHAKTGKKCKDPVKEVLQKEQAVTLSNHTKLISRDGNEYQIADSASPIRDAHGTISGVVLVFRDVTAEYKMRETLKSNEAFLSSIFDSIQDGISVLDKDLTIVKVNGIMEQWYTSHMPLVGKHCFACYQNRNKPCDPCPTLRCLESGKTESDVVPGSSDPGSPVQWIELFSYPVKDVETGEITGAVEFVRDITGRIKAERALKESEALYRHLFESESDAIFLVENETGLILAANQAASALYGYDHATLLTKKNTDLSAEPEKTRQVTETTPVIEDNIITIALRYHRKKDGTVFPVEVTGRFFNWEGREVHIAAIRDITDRMEVQEKLRYEHDLWEQITETSPIGITMVDKDGHITFANRRAEEILHLEKDKITQRNYNAPDWRITDYDGGPFPDEELPFSLIKKHKKPVFNVQHAIQWPNGDCHYLSINAAPLFDENGHFKSMIASIEDITEAKQSQIERVRLIRELENKNAELERFTYTVSHDLRSPIVTIQGFIGMLKKDVKSQKYQHLEKYTDFISDAARQMEHLLKDLLELSRIGRVVNPSLTISMNEIVKNTQHLLAENIQQKKVKFKVQSNMPSVCVDSVRIQEVMNNLVENAIKFMGDNATPLIQIGCKNLKTEYQFSVKDNGIGVESQYHDKIFGLFNQLDKEFEGTGVGLSLVKRIVEFHGGRIWVESEGKKRGTTFYFTLPKKYRSEK